MNPMKLAEVKPGDVHANPLNPRKDLGDLSALAASIKEVGLIQPPIVSPDANGKGFTLLAGERRTAASVLAGLKAIPVLVVDANADRDTIIKALVENIHREGLTDLEVAQGYQQLLDLGLKESEVAKRVSAKPKAVKDHLAILAAAATSRTRLQERTLTLDEALALMPLEGQADLYEEALKAVGTADFRYEVEQANREVATRAAKEAVKADCEAKGLRFEPYSTWEWDRVETLPADVAEKHQTFPCHVVVVNHNNEAEARCTKPASHRAGGKAPDETPEQAEARKAERKNLIESNKAGDAANAVRREWIAQFLTRKRYDRQVLVYAATTLAIGGLDYDGLRVARAFLPESAGTGDVDQATRFLLAAALTMAEQGVEKDFWRSQREAFADHLRALATFGYEPCAPEVAFLKKHPAKNAGK